MQFFLSKNPKSLEARLEWKNVFPIKLLIVAVRIHLISKTEVVKQKQIKIFLLKFKILSQIKIVIYSKRFRNTDLEKSV